MCIYPNNHSEFYPKSYDLLRKGPNQVYSAGNEFLLWNELLTYQASAWYPDHLHAIVAPVQVSSLAVWYWSLHDSQLDKTVEDFSPLALCLPTISSTMQKSHNGGNFQLSFNFIALDFTIKVHDISSNIILTSNSSGNEDKFSNQQAILNYSILVL